ncbi:uncharacterized protein LOC110244411 [Exaiptasia diaphana]|uniref:Uncharacterized protein n=1 Tax=Exaiptasia diaphana TaxID=2652724 RepID=A0A913YMU1_EXADI|nr:uncharacterized protein LOC110244411 [Exaiptasia diaphana]
MDEQSVISPSGLRSPARYIVIHDFQASKTDEIDLSKGDVVLVVKKYKDGWFRGVRCRGYQVGCFPGNFVAIEASPLIPERPTFPFDEEAPPPLPPKTIIQLEIQLPTFPFDEEAPPPLPPKTIKTGVLVDIETSTNQNDGLCKLEYPADEPPALPKKQRELRTLEMDIHQNANESDNKRSSKELDNGDDNSIQNGHRNSSISTSSFMGLKMLQDSALSKYSEDSYERKRTRAAEELLTSEMSYFSGINILISNYLRPIKDLCLIPKDDIHRIFSNIETLASISKEMVSKLQQRLAKWDPEKTEIGDALLEVFAYLKMFEPYFNTRKKGNEVKSKLEKSNDKFRTIVSKVINGQTMDSLLLMPIQRIPRYEMLLKELVKRTKEDHPDYGNLKEALLKSQKAAAELNEHLRRIENETKIIEIMKSFPNDELNLIHVANQICLARTFGSGRLKKQEKEQMYSINKKIKRMSLPLASAIEVPPQTPLTRSNTASPVPGRRQHFESDSDSDSEPDPGSVLGDKFITSTYIYEGPVERVTRKATGSSEGGMVHETVERYLFLFNDVILVSVASDNVLTGKRTHKLKNALPLSQSWVMQSHVYYSNPPENMFLLGTPSQIYKFLAPSVREKQMWEQKLKDCIVVAKESLLHCFKGIPLPDQQFTAVTVEAKIDYNKTVDVELNLREKEEVLVIGFKDGSVWQPGLYNSNMYDFTLEWWPGIQKGKFGWFPAQCVTGPDTINLSVTEEEVCKHLYYGTCKVESEFTIADVFRQYTLHKSFCKAKIDIDNLDLWEESTDGSVHRLLPREETLGQVIGTWGQYRDNMKLVIREKGETRAGSKSAILDM